MTNQEDRKPNLAMPDIGEIVWTIGVKYAMLPDN